MEAQDVLKRVLERCGHMGLEIVDGVITAFSDAAEAARNAADPATAAP